MKKLLAILFLFLLWSNVSHSREYCHWLNDQKKTLDVRVDSWFDLSNLGAELECKGKLKEAEIYKEKFLKQIAVWVEANAPWYPKGSKPRYKICGQIHLNDDLEGSFSDPIKMQKYRQCEKERLEENEQKSITYLYDLFYELEK